MNKIFFTTLLSLLSLQAFGQNTILESYFESVISKRPKSIAKADMETLFNDDLVLDQFAGYLQDPQLKREAIRLLGRIGNGHQNQSVRQVSVHQLLGFALENDSKMQATIIDKLINYQRKDFDEEALSLADNVLRTASTHIKDFALLGGFLGRESVLLELERLHKDNKKNYRNISLALARCGKQAKTASLLASLGEVPKEDAFVYQIAPLLLYVRQKKTVDYILNLINNNDANCTAGGDHRSAKVVCGYRLMEMVAPYIIDFPIPLDAYGEAIINDYPTDLEKVRVWILENMDHYQLNTDIY